MTPRIKMASWLGSCNSALYFTVVLVLHIASAAADVIVTFDGNITDNFLSMPSNFGHAIPEFGLTGLLYIAEPLDGCKPIERAPSIVNGTRIPDLQFALIRRGNCQFDEKVLQAQEAGFNAAIVYNDNSNGILPMTGSEYAPYVTIPSVFVGIDDGLILRGYDYSTGRYITITRGTSLPWGYYLYPFITVLTTCFIFSCFYGVTKFIRDRRRLRRIRLSRDHLKKLPIIKFKKGDDRYDCCAICLDDYEEGNKLRVLPCNHAFHCKCIDPWLTNSRRTCPICKRKVVPPGVPDSDQESSDDDDSSVDENTPLLGGASGPRPRSPTAPPEVMMWGAVGGSDREVVLDPPMSPPAVCESYDSGIANNSHAEDNNLELAPPSDRERDQEEEEQGVDRPIDQSLDHLLDVAIDVEGPNNTAPIV